MARIRTLKPEFWADEKLCSLDVATRLVFLGLISMADDAGRLVDNVKQIDAALFPATRHTSKKALVELAGLGRIRRGQTPSGQSVIQIVNWSKHQRVDHPNMQAALPPIASNDKADTDPPREALAKGDGVTREELATRSVPTTSTNDQKNASRARDPGQLVRGLLGPWGALPALDAILAGQRHPAGLLRQLWSILNPEDGTQGPGGRPIAAEIVALALIDAETTLDGKWNAAWFRKAIVRILREKADLASGSKLSQQEPGTITASMIDEWEARQNAA